MPFGGLDFLPLLNLFYPLWGLGKNHREAMGINFKCVIHAELVTNQCVFSEKSLVNHSNHIEDGNDADKNPIFWKNFQKI